MLPPQPTVEAIQAPSTLSEQTSTKTEIRAAKRDKPIKPTRDELNELELAYIRLEKGTVSCKSEIVGQYAYSACRYASLNGKSAWQVWYYNNQKDPQKRFFALNGKARSTYDSYLLSNASLADYDEVFGLPMLDDMKLDDIINVFGE
jgi:hypothetical protein